MHTNGTNGHANGNGHATNGEDQKLLTSGEAGKEVAAEVVKTAPSVLLDINLVIPAGKLTIVCGSVGAGFVLVDTRLFSLPARLHADVDVSHFFSRDSKSSLLSGLLGEMKRKRGEVSISGTVGYCGQTAWIQNSNVSAST